MQFYPNIRCCSQVVIIFTDHDQPDRGSANPRTSKKDVAYASGYTMLTCIRMQNLIKIYHIVQELDAFSLTGLTHSVFGLDVSEDGTTLTDWLSRGSNTGSLGTRL